MVTTSVIVVNYRTAADLTHFISSYHDTVTDGELIVIDVDVVEPFVAVGTGVPPYHYISMRKNEGYAAACNLGARLASGKVLAFFNADVVLLPGTVDDTAEALMKHDAWGIAGPLQYSSAGLVTHAGIFGTHSAPLHRSWQKRVTDQYRDVKEAITVSGSAFFIKRECWDDMLDCPIWQERYPDAGAFLPTFLFYEETALSYHAWAHGWRVMYYGEAECIHEWHASIKKHGSRKCLAESQAMFRAFCDAHKIPRN